MRTKGNGRRTTGDGGRVRIEFSSGGENPQMRRVLDVDHSDSDSDSDSDTDSDSGIRTTDDGQRMTGEGGRVRIEFLSGVKTRK
jgi:hypothetical protein